jgi:GT2 family glycosyltransferase
MPVDVSIVIVNYNVKAFLQQCLYSVKKACKGIESEVFVVDNNSVDDSVEMLKQNFPEINLIANTKIWALPLHATRQLNSQKENTFFY